MDVVKDLLRTQIGMPHRWRLEHKLCCLANEELSDGKELLSGEGLISVVDFPGHVP